MQGCPQGEQVSAGLFLIAPGATCNCSVTSGAHLHLLQPWRAHCQSHWTVLAASASASFMPVISRREEVCTSLLTLLGQCSAQCPAERAPAGRSAVQSGPRLRDCWRQQETTQQIFQNEDLQSLIIHTQSVEALCPDKQTSTPASVRPAAGLALIQACGKDFCLN